MGTNQFYGAIKTHGNYISTGVFKLTHGLLHTNYTIVCTPLEPNIYVYLESKKQDYCILRVKTLKGKNINGRFDYSLIGDNHPRR